MNDRPAPELLAPTNCDHEPIHVPGAIQPHGLLLAFTEADFRVVAVSSNLGQFVPLRPQDVLGRSLADVFDARSAAALRAALDETGATVGSAHPDPSGEAPGAEFGGSIHRHDGLTFVELETPEYDLADAHAFFSRTSGAIKRLQAATTLQGACAAAAREVRGITGFDRVKIYRFADDFSGRVIAEDRVAGVESFLGLHFPPSDIPAQARKLYALNPLRIIPDIDYRPAPLIPDLNPLNGQPIDLSLSVLRSVSPIHLEYMRNIGMRGTMSISIMRGERLWGLIACHNREPRYAGPDARQASEMVAQVLAWQIGVMEEEAVTRQTLKGQAIQRSLIGDIEQLRDHRAGLVRNGAELLELMGASGLCLHSREGVTTLGATPPEPASRKPGEHSWGDAGAAELFQTDRLSALLPEAAGYADVASGVLAVPLSRSPPRRVMLWFRPEVAQTVRWAGNPDKPVTVVEGEVRLGPAILRGLDRGNPRPGDPLAEPRNRRGGGDSRSRHRRDPAQHRETRAREQPSSRAATRSWRPSPMSPRTTSRSRCAISRLSRGCWRIHPPDRRRAAAQSGRRDRKLFAATAQPDQGPRRILPGRAAGEAPGAGLAAGHRPGRGRRPAASAFEEAGATVEIDALPVVHCDHNQMRQVLQNLLSNAVKYRHSGRPCHIQRVHGGRARGRAARRGDGREPCGPYLRQRQRHRLRSEICRADL